MCEKEKGPKCPKCFEEVGLIDRMLLLTPKSKYDGITIGNPPGHHADICYCKRCESFWSFWYSLTKIEEHADVKIHSEFPDSHGYKITLTSEQLSKER